MKLKEIFFALVGGVLTALAFPKFELYFLAWIALIPWFHCLSNKKSGSSFLLGWAAGSAFYAVLLYWIPAVPSHYGGLSPVFSFITYLGFSLFLGLFWAFFSLIYVRIHRSFPRNSFLLAPFLWISFEYLITHVMTGFPWGLLGYSQYKNPYFIQLAAVTGVYGLSLVLILFQTSFLYSIKSKKRWPFFSALALVAVIHLGGFISYKTITPQENSFRAAAIQGNVSADTDFSLLSDQDILKLFNHHLELSRQAVTQGSQLVIWPELSVPFCFSCEYSYFPDLSRRLSDFAYNNNTTILLGTNEIKASQGKYLYFNAASSLSSGRNLKFYFKRHLVPFGEYTPYKFIFSFISNFTHAIGELTPGKELILHEHNGVPFGCPICYEIIFPDLVRRFVKNGAEFLVTITNDAWYGNSSAPYQHFAMAVLRAVENRRFVVRAATTGISGIIDPFGRVMSRSQLNTAVFLSGQITPSRSLTLYTRWGDILSYTGLTLSVLFFILTLLKKHEKKRSQQRKKPIKPSSSA